jgi:hypothetical protein
MMPLTFGGIRHVIEYPSKRFGFVGSVPHELAYQDGKTRTFDTVEQALAASRPIEAGKLCDINTCMCRKYFTGDLVADAFMSGGGK